MENERILLDSETNEQLILEYPDDVIQENNVVEYNLSLQKNNIKKDYGRRKQQFNKTTAKPSEPQSGELNLEIPGGYVLLWQPKDALQSNTELNSEENESEFPLDFQVVGNSEEILSEDATNHDLSYNIQGSSTVPEETSAESEEFQRRASIIESLRAGRSPAEIISYFKYPRSIVYNIAAQFYEAEESEEGSSTPCINKPEVHHKEPQKQNLNDLDKSLNKLSYNNFQTIQSEVIMKEDFERHSAEDEKLNDNFVNIKQECLENDEKMDEFIIKPEQHQLAAIEEDDLFIDTEDKDKEINIENIYKETTQDGCQTEIILNSPHNENFADNYYAETYQDSCHTEVILDSSHNENIDDNYYAENTQDSYTETIQDNTKICSDFLTQDERSAKETTEGEFVLQFDSDDDLEDTSNSEIHLNNEASSFKNSDNLDKELSSQDFPTHFLLGNQQKIQHTNKVGKYVQKISLLNHKTQRDKDQVCSVISELRSVISRNKNIDTSCASSKKNDSTASSKKYFCPACSMDLRKMSYYVKHMEIVHNISIGQSSHEMSNKNQSSHRCGSCDRTFLLIENLQRHIKLCDKLKELKCRQEAQKVMGVSAPVTEVRINNFPCHLCNVVLKTVDSLQLHIMVKHRKFEVPKQITKSVASNSAFNKPSVNTSQQPSKSTTMQLQQIKQDILKLKSKVKINLWSTNEEIVCETYSNPKKRQSEEMPIQSLRQRPKLSYKEIDSGDDSDEDVIIMP